MTEEKDFNIIKNLALKIANRSWTNYTYKSLNDTYKLCKHELSIEDMKKIEDIHFDEFVEKIIHHDTPPHMKKLMIESFFDNLNTTLENTNFLGKILNDMCSKSEYEGFTLSLMNLCEEDGKDGKDEHTIRGRFLHCMDILENDAKLNISPCFGRSNTHLHKENRNTYYRIVDDYIKDQQKISTYSKKSIIRRKCLSKLAHIYNVIEELTKSDVIEYSFSRSEYLCSELTTLTKYNTYNDLVLSYNVQDHLLDEFKEFQESLRDFVYCEILDYSITLNERRFKIINKFRLFREKYPTKTSKNLQLALFNIFSNMFMIEEGARGNIK